MKTTLPVLAAMATSLGILATTATAHALGPVDLEVGLKAGVGTNPDSGGGVNPLGFGVGGRGGVVLLSSIYLGVNVMYYLGGSQDGTSVNTLMYGGEVGYGFTLLDKLLTIRPQVGLGNATFSASAGSVSVSNSNLYLEPGVTGLVSLGLFFVGADANLLFFPGLNDSQMGVTLHGQVGLKF